MRRAQHAVLDGHSGHSGAELHAAARFQVFWIIENPRQIRDGQFEALVRKHQSQGISPFCYRRFNDVRDGVDSSAGRDAHRL